MHARLTVHRGANTPHVDIRLPTIIGRGTSAKLKVPSSTVSRQHCEIYEYDRQIAVRDLGSSNGTIVNGHRIDRPLFVTPEDEIRIGPVAFHLAPIDLPQPANASASTNADVPQLENIPSTTDVPESVEEGVASDKATAQSSSDDEVHAEAVPDREEGSVLEYSEAKADDARSFVGIVDEQQSNKPPPEKQAPELESNEERVAGDDSSLQSFFDQLE